MTDKIKGNPKACPYCKSSNFIHTGTGAFSHFSENSRHVIINKNFLCNECKKYFFSQDEADIPIGKEKGCNHNNLEKSYSLFYYPGTKTPYDGISVFFCTDCCCYLLTCNTIKSDLEEALDCGQAQIPALCAVAPAADRVLQVAQEGENGLCVEILYGQGLRASSFGAEIGEQELECVAVALDRIWADRPLVPKINVEEVP